MKIIIELLSSFPAMPRSQPRRSSVGWGSMILAMLLCVAMGRALIVSWRRPTEHEALRVAHVAKALHGQLIEKNTEIVRLTRLLRRATGTFDSSSSSSSAGHLKSLLNATAAAAPTRAAAARSPIAAPAAAAVAPFAQAMQAFAPTERAKLRALAAQASTASGGYPSHGARRVDVGKTADFTQRMEGLAGVGVVRRAELFHALVHEASASSMTTAGRNPSLHDAGIVESLLSNHRESYKRYGRQIKSGGAAWVDMELEHYKPGSVEPIPGIAVLHHAFVDDEGNVCDAKHCIAQRSCETKVARPRRAGAPQDQLYVVSQNQGYGFWHFFGEDFVRISVGIDLLLADPTIKVHVIRANSFTKDYMKLVGIDAGRLISGAATAKVLFLPEPSACGAPARYVVRQTRRMLRSALALAPASALAAARAQQTPRILVLKRSGSRKVLNHDALIAALQAVAGNEVVVEVFDDKANLGARKTLELFATSPVIVGPHGAGLSNLAVAPPGTTVVEFIVSGKAINLCYMTLSIKLGLHYHAVTDPTSGHAKPMTVDVAKVAAIAKAALLVASA